MKLSAFDLEATGTGVDDAQVVQAAVVSAGVGRVRLRDLRSTESFSQANQNMSVGQRVELHSTSEHVQLFHVPEIPRASTKVHGITAEQVADCKPFGRCVVSFSRALTVRGVVAVSFNGCRYDVAVIARYLLARELALYEREHGKKPAAGAPPRPTQEAIELRLRKRHVDVYRLWQRVRRSKSRANCYAGSLSGAHLYYTGEEFDGAHDAAVDCTATLRVLDCMLREGDVPDVDTAIAWSNKPLPGDVDFAGKFRWDVDQAVFAFGKHRDEPLESKAAAGFLTWMLGKDFSPETKRMIKRYQAGEYPAREYENEV